MSGRLDDGGKDVGANDGRVVGLSWLHDVGPLDDPRYANPAFKRIALAAAEWSIVGWSEYCVR